MYSPRPWSKTNDQPKETRVVKLVQIMEEDDFGGFEKELNDLRDINSFIIDEPTNGNRLNVLHISVAVDCLSRASFVKRILATGQRKQPKLDVNAIGTADGYKVTAGHLAAMWGHAETLDLLLDHGIDAFICDDRGNSIYDYASDQGNYECIKVLEKFYRKYYNLKELSFQANDSDSASDFSSIDQIQLVINQTINDFQSLNLEATPSLVETESSETNVIPDESKTGFDYDIINGKLFDDEEESLATDTIESSNIYRDEENDITLIEEICKPNKTLVEVLETSCDLEGFGQNVNLSLLNDSVANLNDSELFTQLKNHGDSPGPMTPTTKDFYRKRLRLLRRGEVSPSVIKLPLPGYSQEINEIIQKEFAFSIAERLEKEFIEKVENSCKNAKKSFFTYILLDPSVTNNIAMRAASEERTVLFRDFIKAIFYVGKGQKDRLYMHFYEAVEKIKLKNNKTSAKIEKIRDIWSKRKGVVSLHCFHGVCNAEALTREALMIEAIGLTNLTNILPGSVKISLGWNHRKRKLLGTYFLFKAFQLLLIEGERQIKQADV